MDSFGLHDISSIANDGQKNQQGKSDDDSVSSSRSSRSTADLRERSGNRHQRTGSHALFGAISKAFNAVESRLDNVLDTSSSKFARRSDGNARTLGRQSIQERLSESLQRVHAGDLSSISRNSSLSEKQRILGSLNVQDCSNDGIGETNGYLRGQSNIHRIDSASNNLLKRSKSLDERDRTSVPQSSPAKYRASLDLHNLRTDDYIEDSAERDKSRNQNLKQEISLEAESKFEESMTIAESNRVTELENRLSSAIAALRLRNEDSSDATNSLNAKVADLLYEGEQLSRKELKLRSALKSVRREVGQTQSELECATQELCNLRNEMKVLRKQAGLSHERGSKIAKLEQKNQDLLSDNKQKEETIISLRKAIQGAAEKLANVKVEHKNELSELHKQNAIERENEILQCKKEAAEIIERLKNERLSLSKQIASTKQESESEIAKMRHEITALEARVEHFRSQVEARTDGGGDCSSEILQLSKQLDDALKELRLARQHVQNSEQERISQKDELNREIENLRTKLTIRDQEAEESENCFAQLEKDLSLSFDRIQKLQGLLEEKEKEFLKLKKNDIEGALQPDADNAATIVSATDEGAMDSVAGYPSMMVEAQRTLQLESHTDHSEKIDDKFEEDEVDNDPFPDSLPFDQRSLSNGTGDDRFSSQSQSAKPSTNVALIEGLTSSVRRLESSLALAQAGVKRLNAQRDAAREESSRLYLELKSANAREEGLLHANKDYEDVKQRYEKTLELYGESCERISELEQDVQDLKQMYRSQITELIDKVH